MTDYPLSATDGEMILTAFVGVCIAVGLIVTGLVDLAWTATKRNWRERNIDRQARSIHTGYEGFAGLRGR
jgi:hypothetical protein